MSEIEKLRKNIDELEEEFEGFEGYDFDSYSYFDIKFGMPFPRLLKEEKNS